MAYIAALSLIHSLEQVNKLVPMRNIKRLFEAAASIASSLQEIIPEGEESLETEIRHALWRAEDIVESYQSTLFLSVESESWVHGMRGTWYFFYDLLEVIQEIESTKERVDKFVHDLKCRKSDDMLVQRAYSSPAAQPSNDSPQCQNKMVGLDWELERVKRHVLGDDQLRLGTVLIYGMGGIGKTALSISFYNDSDIRKHFIFGAWVKISLEHCQRDILLSLLHTLEAFGDGRLVEKISDGPIEGADDYRLEGFVRQLFGLTRYLVVLDCLSDIPESSWYYIKGLLPDSNNGSRIIVATRVLFTDEKFVLCYQKCFLDEQESWNLLREQVFGEEQCPPSLERIGKRIARNCQGLPLAIITVGHHLAKEEKTVEYWNKVAESRNSVAYAADGASMYKQLSLSYKQTPLHMRPIFLCMGVSPSLTIDVELLMDLCFAEGFIEQEEYRIESLSARWLMYFLRRNLIDVRDDSSWNLHSAMWHYCRSEAEKEEFVHVVGKYRDWDSPRPGGMNIILRRLVIQNTVSFIIRKLNHSLSTIRSLLFTPPYHPYPLRISFGGYKLLKVLKALTIRFYEFPVEILSLTLLRYIALTLNKGEIPVGISKLRYLKILIVHLHQIVRSIGGAPSYLPVEIWEMQQLILLECAGSDLPIPPESSHFVLPNLSTLLDVSLHSCTEEVLKRIPNLTELALRINLAPVNDASPLCPFDHLALLQKLQRIRIVITNPYFEKNSRPQVVAMPKRVSDPMSSLTWLILSGCGFPWESIEWISQLPFLQELHLQCHAFRGPKWELTNGMGFKKIKSLVLEDLDLIDWIVTSRDIQFFPQLGLLKIIRCHKLQHISPDFAYCSDLQVIEVIDSTPAVETWAQFIQMERSQTVRVRLEISNPKGPPMIRSRGNTPGLRYVNED